MYFYKLFYAKDYVIIKFPHSLNLIFYYIVWIFFDSCQVKYIITGLIFHFVKCLSMELYSSRISGYCQYSLLSSRVIKMKKTTSVLTGMLTFFMLVIASLPEEKKNNQSCSATNTVCYKLFPLVQWCHKGYGSSQALHDCT